MFHLNCYCQCQNLLRVGENNLNQSTVCMWKYDWNMNTCYKPFLVIPREYSVNPWCVLVRKLYEESRSVSVKIQNVNPLYRSLLLSLWCIYIVVLFFFVCLFFFCLFFVFFLFRMMYR